MVIETLCTFCGPFYLKQMRLTRSHFTCSLKPLFVAADAMFEMCVQKIQWLLRNLEFLFSEKTSKLYVSFDTREILNEVCLWRTNARVMFTDGTC